MDYYYFFVYLQQPPIQSHPTMQHAPQAQPLPSSGPSAQQPPSSNPAQVCPLSVKLIKTPFLKYLTFRLFQSPISQPPPVNQRPVIPPTSQAQSVPVSQPSQSVQPPQV